MQYLMRLSCGLAVGYICGLTFANALLILTLITGWP